MIVKAVVTGDESLAIQTLYLDPYVRSINQARAIWDDYYREYRTYLPTFRRSAPGKPKGMALESGNRCV